jgi:outer membrane protein OmpA-like peptidoglycan-associated protein
MKIYFTLVLAIFITSFSNAQSSANCTKQVAGIITNVQTDEFLAGVKVQLFIQGEEEPVSVVTTAEDATYSFTIDCRTRYIIEAGKENFTISRKIIYPSVNSDNKELPLSLFPIKEFLFRDTNKLIDVGHVGFEADGSEISKTMEEKINKVANVMAKYPNIRISVDVHTDSKGDSDYSLSISKERAEAVVSYLIGKGVDPDRLESYGYGDTQLINHCAKDVDCSEIEHKQNRRIDFVVIE